MCHFVIVSATHLDRDTSKIQVDVIFFPRLVSTQLMRCYLLTGLRSLARRSRSFSPLEVFSWSKSFVESGVCATPSAHCLQSCRPNPASADFGQLFGPGRLEDLPPFCPGTVFTYVILCVYCRLT